MWKAVTVSVFAVSCLIHAGCERKGSPRSARTPAGSGTPAAQNAVREERANTFLSEATKAFEQGDLEDASALLEKARAAKPDLPGVDKLVSEIEERRAAIEAEQERKARIASALEDGRRELEAGNEDAAVAKANEVLALDEGNEAGQKLHEEALSAKEAKLRAERAQRYNDLSAKIDGLMEKGEWDEAMAGIAEIKALAALGAGASRTGEVNTCKAGKLADEAAKLVEAGKLDEALAKLDEAKELAPAASVEERIASLKGEIELEQARKVGPVANKAEGVETTEAGFMDSFHENVNRPGWPAPTVKPTDQGHRFVYITMEAEFPKGKEWNLLEFAMTDSEGRPCQLKAFSFGTHPGPNLPYLARKGSLGVWDKPTSRGVPLVMRGLGLNPEPNKITFIADDGWPGGKGHLCLIYEVPRSETGFTLTREPRLDSMDKPVTVGPEHSGPAGRPAEKPPTSPLPAYTRELRGSNQVRVRNPNDFSVKVGVRSGGGGKDFTVGANGVASVFVPDGKYDIYFVYSNKPDALYQGDSFTLKRNGVEIRIVKVVGGNYGIRRVK